MYDLRVITNFYDHAIVVFTNVLDIVIKCFLQLCCPDMVICIYVVGYVCKNFFCVIMRVCNFEGYIRDMESSCKVRIYKLS